jgi:7,8-dihydropterin-6-yl-methyl-4-(beta-D-ribofuranosyl)aminobenzene 5'-phosphate synthase
MTEISNALNPIDGLTVDVLTDNVSDNYVTKTLFAVSEFANIVRAGAKTISGEALLCGNLGYGLRLVSRIDGIRHTLLFDTGPEPAVFIRNCANLGIPMREIECIAVSHGHWDHMAALPATVGAIVQQGGRVTVHVNPDMFNERGVRLTSGSVIPAAKVPSPAELEQRGGAVVNRLEERLLLDGHFYYSAEIPRITAFEKGRSDHLCRTSPDAAWQPDIPIHCVMGGLHLGGVMEAIIPETVEGLRPFGIKYIITGHCTGWRALHALANAFGDGVSQSAVGTTYTFAADEPH